MRRSQPAGTLPRAVGMPARVPSSTSIPTRGARKPGRRLTPPGSRNFRDSCATTKCSDPARSRTHSGSRRARATATCGLPRTGGFDSRCTAIGDAPSHQSLEGYLGIHAGNPENLPGHETTGSSSRTTVGHVHHRHHGPAMEQRVLNPAFRGAYGGRFRSDRARLGTEARHHRLPRTCASYEIPNP